MSQEFITREELQQTLQAVERRLETKMTAFITEVNGHIARMGEEATSGRRDLIESNQDMVTEFRRLRDQMDLAVAAESRYRDAMASRLGTVEGVLEEVKRLAKQIAGQGRTTQ